MNTARRDAEWLAYNRPHQPRPDQDTSSSNAFDTISKPSHYTAGRQFETIEVIEDWELGFRLGNAVKYISRAGRKDPSKTIEDLKKARWYLDREIEANEAELLALDEQEEAEFNALAEITLAEEWVPFDGTLELDLWDPSVGPTEPEEKPVFAGNYKGPLYAPHPEIKKDLDKFEDKEIYKTEVVDGAILGIQKNGDVAYLGKVDEPVAHSLYEHVVDYYKWEFGGRSSDWGEW